MSTPDTRALACELTIDTRAMETRADGDARVPVAISSEAPVLRYDYATGTRYYEVLDHSADAVNMAWAQRGIPLLLSHDSRDQYGLVTDLTIGDDRKLRGWIKFSRGSKAQEIRQDILDGIRPMVSVGYSTGDDFTPGGRTEDGIEVRRFRNWTVFEVSTVPIPADPSVGIGRSHPASDAPTPPAVEARSEHMETPTVPTAPAAPAPVALPHTSAGETRSRESIIYSFAASAGLNAREAQQLVDSGRDAESIGTELLARMNQQANHAATPKPAVELTDKEQREYSLMRALESIVSGKRGFEMEVSDEFAKQTGRSYTNGNSFFLPMNIRTQLSIGAANKGGELRATELRPELIDLLRQRSLAIGTLGARFMPGLVGNVAFPRQTAAMAANWVAEAPGSDMALSSLSLDQVTLSPRTLQASTTVSRQLLAQSTPAADQIVFDDIIAQHAVALDTAVLYGTGTGNQPTGVGVVAGTNLINMGTNGGQATLARVLEAFREIEVDNALTDNVTFVTTPQMKYSMAAIVRFASTDSRTLWDIDTNTVIGAPAYATNNLPSNLTKGTSNGVCHAAIVGDFSQVMVGEWGSGAEIIVDPFTLARRNLIQITSIQFADVQVRIPSAFAVYRDLLV